MRVVLADDHRMVRDGVRAVLATTGVEVVGEAGNGLEAIAEAKRRRPDVVVVDVSMPELNGIDATRRLIEEVPGVKVIVLTQCVDPRSVLAALNAGATGYVLKTAAAEEFLGALTAVEHGETYLSPAIARNVVDQALARAAGLPRPENRLSLRERQVLQLVAEGKSSKEIATALDIAVPTVETHRRQITTKLGLRSVAELTKYAIREGLTSAEP